MSAKSAMWGDLGPRIGSAVVLSGVTGGVLFGGQEIWAVAVLILCLVMLWELGPLCEPGLSLGRRVVLALSPVIAIVAIIAFAPTGPHGPTGGMTLARATPVLLPALIGLIALRGGRAIWFGYATLVVIAALSLVGLRGLFGPKAVLFLILIVVISDTAGYFAGRMLGGPKFWPRVSPKKTWSGTVAGWVGAGIFGAAIAQQVELSAMVGALLAMVLAFAGQMGDILESAMKRRVGIKDSSNLIPGHGGFLDRLDALVVAAAVAGLAQALPALLGA